MKEKKMNKYILTGAALLSFADAHCFREWDNKIPFKSNLEQQVDALTEAIDILILKPMDGKDEKELFYLYGKKAAYVEMVEFFNDR